jgi:hypothetical protein
VGDEVYKGHDGTSARKLWTACRMLALQKQRRTGLHNCKQNKFGHQRRREANLACPKCPAKP